MGQRKRDDTKAEAASAKVFPPWRASIREDLPTGYLEQVARRPSQPHGPGSQADTYDLDLATEFRIAAELPRGLRHQATLCSSRSPQA